MSCLEELKFLLKCVISGSLLYLPMTAPLAQCRLRYHVFRFMVPMVFSRRVDQDPVSPRTLVLRTLDSMVLLMFFLGLLSLTFFIPGFLAMLFNVVA